MRRYLILGVNPVPWKAPQGSCIRSGSRCLPRFYKPEEVVVYQQAIKEQMALMSPAAILEEHERLELNFYLWRQAGTKADHIADATNMQKALEDALQGVLFKNDRNVVHVSTWIMDQGPNVEPRIFITIDEAAGPPSLTLESTDSIAAIKHTPEPDNFTVEDFF